MDKILAVQAEIGVLSKDKKNPFFKSSYFDINQIIEQLLPLLEKHKLVVVQPLTHLEGKPALQTLVFASDSAIPLMSYTTPLPENIDPQKMGSAITYYRRYALQSMFLLRAEDDDANVAKPKDSSPF